MKQIIRDYFTFNRREKRGIFVLLCIIALLVLYLQFSDLLFPPEVPDMALFEEELARMQAAVQAQRDTSEEPGYEEREYSSGLPPRRKYKQEYPSAHKPLRIEQRSPKERIPPAKVELNTADSIQLLALRGIGPAFAHRILAYRNLLGGYIRKEQLLEVYGFDNEKLGLVAGVVLVDSSLVRKININTAGMPELKKHPYIRYNLARAILSYRKQHGPFGTVGAIRGIDLLNDEVYSKLAPYLTVE